MVTKYRAGSACQGFTCKIRVVTIKFTVIVCPML
jgi:hypothetical protein